MIFHLVLFISPQWDQNDNLIFHPIFARQLVLSEQAKIAQNLNFKPENTELKGDKVGLIWSVRLSPRYDAARTKWIKLNRKSISKKKMKFWLDFREANHFQDSGSDKSLIELDYSRKKRWVSYFMNLPTNKIVDAL